MTLMRGATGASVTALQKALVKVGYPIKVDGQFGAETDAAVRAFQTAMGLRADGVVGVLTVNALEQAVDQGLKVAQPIASNTPAAPAATPSAAANGGVPTVLVFGAAALAIYFLLAKR